MYHVVIPGDPTVFSLTQDKIDFRENLKGVTLAENIENIKKHGPLHMVNSWENIRISPIGNKHTPPELWGKLGSTNPLSKKIAPQYLSGVQTSDDVIEYQFLKCFDNESAASMRRCLFAAWDKNDMPLRDARPWIHDMDCCVGGLASCNKFYAKRLLERDPICRDANTRHTSETEKKSHRTRNDDHAKTQAKYKELESTLEKHIRQQKIEHDAQTRNKQRIIDDRMLRYNAAMFRYNA
jgi:hypothetical protein